MHDVPPYSFHFGRNASQAGQSFVGVMIPMYLSILCFFILITATSATIHSSSMALTSVQKSFRENHKAVAVTGDEAIGSYAATQNEFLTKIVELAIGGLRVEPAQIARSATSIIIEVAPSSLFLYREPALQPAALDFLSSLLSLANFYKAQRSLRIEIILKDNYLEQTNLLSQGAQLLSEVGRLGFNQEHLSLGVSYTQGHFVTLKLELK